MAMRRLLLPMGAPELWGMPTANGARPRCLRCDKELSATSIRTGRHTAARLYCGDTCARAFQRASQEQPAPAALVVEVEDLRRELISAANDLNDVPVLARGLADAMEAGDAARTARLLVLIPRLIRCALMLLPTMEEVIAAAVEELTDAATLPSPSGRIILDDVLSRAGVCWSDEFEPADEAETDDAE